MLSEKMRKAPEGSCMSPVENWWHRHICEFADEVAQLEADNVVLKEQLQAVIDDNAKLRAIERGTQLGAQNAALQRQVEGLQDALKEAKVTLESIDDEHPQTEYALKKVEKALEGDSDD